jgi:hypothetical protein
MLHRGIGSIVSTVSVDLCPEVAICQPVNISLNSEFSGCAIDLRPAHQTASDHLTQRRSISLKKIPE